MAKRESDNVMVPLDRAIELVGRMRGDFYKRLPAERIPIDRSLGRRLSREVRAAIKSPRYHISTMDGYAISSGSRYPLTIKYDVFAGDGGDHTLKRGEAAYITTGAIVPDGADAVLKTEDATVDGITLRGLPLEPWTNVIRAGADFREGEPILGEGSVVTPASVCMLHAAAIESVEVFKKPRVGVLSTGDEIRNGLTRDCNAPMVCAMLEAWGCEASHLGVIPDTSPETKEMMDRAASLFDVVVTIGGVARGKKDFISATVLEGGDVAFHGYRIRPGKPLLVSYYHGKPTFSLPGKPTGAFTSMELIVKRFILGDTIRPSISIPLARDVSLYAKGFDYVVYVLLKGGTAVPMGYEESPLKLFSGSGYGVSVVSSSPRPIVADGYFIARDDVSAGHPVTVYLLR